MDKARLLELNASIKKTHEDIKKLMFLLLDTERELGEIIGGMEKEETPAPAGQKRAETGEYWWNKD